MKCVVLAGAGASVAVDPDTYPSTLDFFKRLPSTITDDDLFKRLLEFLNEKEDGEQIDIELVLWSLGELADALTALRNSQHPIGWFLQGTRLPQPQKALRRPFHVEALREVVKVSAPRVAKLVSDPVGPQGRPGLLEPRNLLRPYPSQIRSRMHPQSYLERSSRVLTTLERLSFDPLRG